LLCISMLSTVVSILTHLNIEIIYSPFLWVKGSFLKGFLYLFVSTSILISSKTFFKFILLLIRTGRVYNTQLEITFFGVYFKIDYEGSHLIDRINERCLYHLSASLSYLSIGFILSTSPIFSDFSDQLILVSVFLSLWDLNPFYKSEMCEFFNSTDIFDKNNPWYLVQGGYLPQSQRSDTEKMFSDLEVKNIYQYTWALFSIMFFLKNTVETFPYVHYVFSSKSAVTEKIAAGYSLYLLILISLFSFSSIFRVLSKNTFSHLNRIFRNLSTKFKRIRSHQISKDELIQNLSSIPILNWFTDEELNTLLEQSEVLMFDNEMILFEEGDFADSLFVLVDGSIRLFKNVIGSKKRKKISTLTACSVFGEHCILDETRRLATAVSKERSTVIKIPREVLMERLNFSKYKIDVNSFRTAVMVDQFFHSAPIFSNLNSHVIQLILSRGLVEELEKPLPPTEDTNSTQ